MPACVSLWRVRLFHSRSRLPWPCSPTSLELSLSPFVSTSLSRPHVSLPCSLLHRLCYSTSNHASPTTEEGTDQTRPMEYATRASAVVAHGAPHLMCEARRLANLPKFSNYSTISSTHMELTHADRFGLFPVVAVAARLFASAAAFPGSGCHFSSEETTLSICPPLPSRLPPPPCLHPPPLPRPCASCLSSLWQLAHPLLLPSHSQAPV